MTTLDAFAHIVPGQPVRELITSGGPVFLSPEAAAFSLPEGHGIGQVLLSFRHDTRFLVETPAGPSRFDDFDAAVDTSHRHGLPAGANVKGLVITSDANSTTFRALPLSAFITGYAPYRGTPITLHASTSPEQDTP